ncbi:MAG: HAD-IIIA family hydrolase [Pseudomonadales bacterium]|jgi:3-deoxy-D-manno-octulosonate 8-phosphate phosphatase (KDO 8-P phosphatase)
MVQITQLPADVLSRAAGIDMVVFDIDGVLTDGRLYYTDDGREMKSFHVHDGSAIKLLRSHAVEVAIITGRSSPIVARRAEELGIAHVYQDSEDKTLALRKLVSATGVDAMRIAYVGDDLPDLDVFNNVGMAIGVADGHPATLAVAHYVTSASGGQGVARELCQLILSAKGLWPYT